MSKYDRLGEFLQKQNVERVPMSFADIERLTEVTLPKSAHKHRPWWSNNPHNSVMTRVWLKAGFESEQVDMARQTLVSRRVAAAPAKPERESVIHPAYGALKGMVRIMPTTDLTAPADPDWGKSPDERR